METLWLKMFCRGWFFWKPTLPDLPMQSTRMVRSSQRAFCPESLVVGDPRANPLCRRQQLPQASCPMPGTRCQQFRHLLLQSMQSLGDVGFAQAIGIRSGTSLAAKLYSTGIAETLTRIVCATSMKTRRMLAEL